MDMYGWMKEIIYLKTVCGADNLNQQVLFYDVHGRHFYDRTIHILHYHHIKTFFLKAGDSRNDQPNYNGPNLKLKGSMAKP